MNVRRWALAIGLGLVAASAFAVARGGTLYIRARNTKLFSAPPPTGSPVDTLQPGTKVVWNGPDGSDARYHRISLESGKAGVVFQSNLGTSPPSTELVASQGAEIDPVAFSQSAAATKALGDGAIQYAEDKDSRVGPDALLRLLAVDSLARKVDQAAIDEFARQRGFDDPGSARAKRRGKR